MNKFISEKTFSVLQFSIAFFFGKGMQFIAPLILANILTLQQYGKIEFAMSVSLSIVSIASFGAFTFIPRSIVQKEKWISKNLIYAYLLVISFIFILLSLILNNSEPSKLFKIIFIFSGILLLQGGLSATLKSQQRRSLAMVLDSMLWIAILISSLGIAAQIFSINGSSLYMVCMTYFTILVIFIWKNIDQAHIFQGNLNIRYFKVGARIIIIGFSSVAIAVSGRFLAGLVFDLEQVGHYSALYRVSIIPIICHQFIILYLYRYAYLSNNKKFSNFGSFVFLCTSFFAIFIWVFVSYFAYIFGSSFEKLFIADSSIFLLLLVNCPIWSAIAVNELAYGKSGDNNKVIYASTIFIVTFAVLTIYYMKFSSLYEFALWHTLWFSMYFLQNSYFCYKSSIPISFLANISVLSIFSWCIYNIFLVNDILI